MHHSTSTARDSGLGISVRGVGGATATRRNAHAGWGCVRPGRVRRSTGRVWRGRAVSCGWSRAVYPAVRRAGLWCRASIWWCDGWAGACRAATCGRTRAGSTCDRRTVNSTSCTRALHSAAMNGSRMSGRARLRTAQLTVAVGISAVLASAGWWLSSTPWTTLDGARISCSVNAYHLVPADPGPPPHPLWDACERSHTPHAATILAVGWSGIAVGLFAAVVLARQPRKAWTAPPGWPPVPLGWQPAIGWSPPPEWPPAPTDWQWWQRPQTVENFGTSASQK